jgi:hypothetical protein
LFPCTKLFGPPLVLLFELLYECVLEFDDDDDELFIAAAAAATDVVVAPKVEAVLATLDLVLNTLFVVCPNIDLHIYLFISMRLAANKIKKFCLIFQE